MGIPFPSKCAYCLKPMNADGHHIFIDSNISKAVWKCFIVQFGIRDYDGDIRQHMMVWWLSEYQNPIHKLLLQTAPLVISWNIWKARNKSKYDQQRGNPGISGGGGVIRRHTGEMVGAFAASFGTQSNNAAESMALNMGLQWCIDQGHKNIIVELDSLLVINWMLGKFNPPWSLLTTIEEAKRKTNFFNEIQFMHCFREANKVADALANEGAEINVVKWFYSTHELPSQARGHLYMDKDQLPNYRIRYSKKLFCL
ncbi:hypothetical protein A4A49_54076 [Nicotiana attenuata]|uniref:RNase H type-1 domain-containing protein n=1 Tax=Nicotiana attenuata TaxID=49451 RepID=A0A1J6K0A0_NICAT|nr:hypothetical protein A4A49_54076 [Nicotiana attenuata]